MKIFTLSKIIRTILFLLTLYLSATTLTSKVLAQTDNCYYNACTEGSICDLGDQYYSPGDYILDESIDFYTEEEKIVPHPYWMEYRDFTCRANQCIAGAASNDFCVSDIDGETPVIRVCTAITLPHCDLRNILPGATGNFYCDISAIRSGQPEVYCPLGVYLCSSTGWECTGALSPETGSCWPHPHPVRRCTDGSFDNLGSGSWVDVPRNTPEQGRCEDMSASMRVGFTPGYIKTQTPYLYQIWLNTVAKIQTIFPFRTAYNMPKLDFPGESAISYDFDPGDAEAGHPTQIHPGWDARIYFRYLGFIHCAKENLLEKLSSKWDPDNPYVYYDERCSIGYW